MVRFLGFVNLINRKGFFVERVWLFRILCLLVYKNRLCLQVIANLPNSPICILDCIYALKPAKIWFGLD